MRDIDYLLLVALLGALIASLLFSAQAKSAELILHGPSYHFDRDAGYNNSNYGAGYMFDNRIITGAYYNSERALSVYAGYSFQIVERLSVTLGLVTGYERASVLPAAVLTYSQPVTENWKLHFNFIPHEKGLINLSVGYQI